MSVDPVGGNEANPQSWNRYGYVRSRPLSLIDRDGRSPLFFAMLARDLVSKAPLIGRAFRENVDVEPTYKVGAKVDGVLGVSADLTHTYDRPGSYPGAGNTTLEAQFIMGISVTLGPDGSGENLALLMGPFSKSLFDSNGWIPGPGEAGFGVTLGPSFSVGGETHGLDSALSESFNVMFMTTTEEALATEILLELQESDGVQEGYQLIQGERVRVVQPH